MKQGTLVEPAATALGPLQGPFAALGYDVGLSSASETFSEESLMESESETDESEDSGSSSDDDSSSSSDFEDDLESRYTED